MIIQIYNIFNNRNYISYYPLQLIVYPGTPVTPHSPAQFAGALATGLSGGLLSGLFGMGGGVILLPLLRLLLGIGQHQAQGVTLAAMMVPGGLPALVRFHRRGITVPWGLAGTLILGFLPGVWAGAEGAGQVPDGPLRWGFVALLVLLAASTAFPRAGPAAAGGKPPPWKGFMVGLAGGVCSGLLGVGGGVVMIPLMALWLRLPQLQAQLISLTVMALPIRFPGVLVYACARTGFPWLVLAGLASGLALGTYFGAAMAIDMPAPRLRGAFAGLMLVTAGALIWNG